MRRYLKGRPNAHDLELATKLADQIAAGGHPVLLISRALSKARTYGQLEALRELGAPTDHLYDEVEETTRDHV